MKFQIHLRLIVCLGFYLLGYGLMTRPVAMVWAAPGDLDTTFGVDNDGDGDVDGYYLSESGNNAFDSVLQSSGNIFVVGGVSGCASTAAYMGQIADFTSAGILDETFNSNTGALSYRYTSADTTEGNLFYGLAKDASENIYATGFRLPNGSTKDLIVAKFNSEGTEDSMFNNSAIYDSGNGDDTGRDIVVDTSNNVIVVGDVAETSGEPDMFVAKFSDTCILTASLTHTYRANGYDRLYGVALDYSDDASDYDIIAVGYTVNETGGVDSAILRLTSELVLDPSFDADGYRTFDVQNLAYDDIAKGVALDASGNIYLTGSVTTPEGDKNVYVAKFSSAGVPDSTFGTDGYVILDSGYGIDEGYSLVVDSANSVVVSGEMANSSGVSSLFVARFDSFGVLDTTFGQASGDVKSGFTLITKETSCTTGIFTNVILDASENILATGGCFYTPDDAPLGESVILAKFEGGHVAPATPVCGNGTVETDEECDDTNIVDGDGCAATCQNEGTGDDDDDDDDTASCGNGALDTGEECDPSPGDLTDGDGCSSTCTIETDSDGDGYFGSKDCDDSDASVHENCANPSESEGGGAGCGCVISKRNPNTFEAGLYGATIMGLALLRLRKRAKQLV